MKITSELILSWGPCEGYDEDRIRDLVGDGMMPLEIMDLEISLRDRVWVIVEYMRHTDRHDELSRMACDMAEAVLPIYEKAYPGDDRPRRAIEAKRAYLAGEIDDEELEAVRVAIYADPSHYDTRQIPRHDVVIDAAVVAAYAAAAYAAVIVSDSAVAYSASVASVAAAHAASDNRHYYIDKLSNIVKSYFGGDV